MKTISIPFRLDGYGKIAVSSTPETIWAGRVRSVIGTPIGGRVMRPDFGSTVPNSLMQADVPGLLETAVQSAAAQWLPDIRIVSLQADDTTYIDGESSIEVQYEIPSSRVDQRTFSVRIF
jgi:phage baseplate assembly protein W